MRRFFLVISLLFPLLAHAAADKAAITAELTLAGGELKSGAPFRAVVNVTVTPPWHINANPAVPDWLVATTVELKGSDGVVIDRIAYPQGDAKKLAWADEPVRLYSGQLAIAVSGHVNAGAAAPLALTGELRYQACDDAHCLQPTAIALSLKTGGAVVAAPPVANTAEANVVERTLRERGLWVTLIFLFLGGLALNLTPCVYPMIAITVSYFGARTEQKTGKALASALAYFFGIVLTYSALGLVVARTGALFGAVLQSPWIVIGIAALLVALALSLFGLYELQPPTLLVQKAAGLSSKAGYLGLFFLGATVGVIAAPCLAPILVALLAYVGQRGDPWLGWWLFFALSCGLGAPYIVLGTFSGLLGRLPKSGTWMLNVKRVLGVVLIGVAVWITLPLWHRGEAPQLGEPFSPEKLAAAETEHRPVIIDFAAAWCGPCREMDRETFSDKRVIAKAKEFVFLRADLTKTGSLEVEKLTKEFAIRGVPTVVFIGPNGREHARLRRTEKIGPDEFLRLMDAARKPAATNAVTRPPDMPAQLLQPF